MTSGGRGGAPRVMAAPDSAEAMEPETTGESVVPAVETSDVNAQAAEPAIPPKKVLVIGDENLLFSVGLQEVYPEAMEDRTVQGTEFTCLTVLSRQNFDRYGLDPAPAQLQMRIRHMIDPTRCGHSFPQRTFDSVLLFLPGLSFAVPKELGNPDRPIFAYRTNLYVFYILCEVKKLLKGEGHLHLVWPEESAMLASPCGAAGLDMPGMLSFCGAKHCEAHFDFSRINAEKFFWPFIFGEVPEEIPEWVSAVQIQSFEFDRNPIPVPLSVALQLHPDFQFVTLKDPSSEGKPPSAGSNLKALLMHEAKVRQGRLKDLYGKCGKSEADAFGLVKDPLEESPLSMPMEVFLTSFDDLPHLNAVLQFQICEDQPRVSVPLLEVLDPRLPTRISRPALPKGPGIVDARPSRKRSRPPEEEWAGMKFYCSLTKICTVSAEKMRLHLAGDLYKRLASQTPGWEASDERADLLSDLQEAEVLEEQQKRAKRVEEAKGKGAKDGKGKGKSKTEQGKGGGTRNGGGGGGSGTSGCNGGGSGSKSSSNGKGKGDGKGKGSKGSKPR